MAISARPRAKVSSQIVQGDMESLGQFRFKLLYLTSFFALWSPALAPKSMAPVFSCSRTV